MSGNSCRLFMKKCTYHSYVPFMLPIQDLLEHVVLRAGLINWYVVNLVIELFNNFSDICDTLDNEQYFACHYE